MDGEIEIILWAFVIVVLFLVVLVVGGQFIQVHFIDNVPVIVKVDQKEVYSGPSVGVSVESSGANTNVSVHGGFLYFFPKAYYTSKDVQVIGMKEGSK